MAKYDALLAELAKTSGKADEKVAALNAKTVDGPVPEVVLVPRAEVLAEIFTADLFALDEKQLLILSIILGDNQLDLKEGSAASLALKELFKGSGTATAIDALATAKSEPVKIPWVTAPVELGGAGLEGTVDFNMLSDAGGG